MMLSPDQVDYLKAFLGGIGVSLTPCVYPLIPITIGYIGIKAAGSKFKGFTLSLIYVSGIAVTYSLLGLAASLTGQLFGAISSNPVTYFLTGIITIIFGLSMLDLFTISIPNITGLPINKKQGIIPVFFLGITSGLIVGPCLTPVLGMILAYLTTKKNIFYGVSLLISFAYGMGAILILCGTFSSILAGLPKSGKWMGYIKRTGAVILLGMGIYFVFKGIRRL